MAARLWLLIVVLLAFAVPSVAQPSDSPPIIVLNEGDLWGLEGGNLEQWTFWGYNQEPVMSPDGTRLAYMAWSPITVEALERSGGIGGGELPGDIRLFDLTTGMETILAEQPADASFFSEGVPDKAVVRGQPAWKPDGSKIAWTEFVYPDTQNMLVVHDLASGQSIPLVTDLPAQSGVPVPMRLWWGESGLVLRSTTADGSTFQDSFLVYSEDGQFLNTIPVPQNSDEFLTAAILLTYEEKEYIGAGYNSGEWELFDPLTGASMPAPGVPELYNPAAPEGALSLALVNNVGGSHYQVLDAEGEPVSDVMDMGFDPANKMSISPQGDAVAFIPFDDSTGSYDSEIVVWQDGDVTEVQVNDQRAFSFLWGPIAWRIRPDSAVG